MADIAEIKELAKTLNLMNVYKGVIDLSDETVSNLDKLAEQTNRSRNELINLILRFGLKLKYKIKIFIKISY